MRLPPFAVLLASLLFPGLAWAEAETRSYAVFKEGERIGTETHRFTRDGDALRVAVVNRSRVSVMFLTFDYRHERQELWRGGQLVEMTAQTDDNGAPHSFSMTRDGGKFRILADGKAGEAPGTALPVTLWTREILNRSALYAVSDGKPQPVAAEKLAPEKLAIGGRAVEAEHYRLTGPLERELWYAPDGTFLKARFLRRGYVIEIVLEPKAETAGG